MLCHAFSSCFFFASSFLFVVLHLSLYCYHKLVIKDFYSYKPSSLEIPSFPRSVWLSVGNDCEFWKNGWLDRDADWDGEWAGPKESCIRWACTLPQPPPGKYGWTIVRGGFARVCHHDGWRRGLFPSYFGQSCMTLCGVEWMSKIMTFWDVAFCDRVVFIHVMQCRPVMRFTAV